MGGEFWPAVEKTWLRRGKEKDFISEMKEMRERIATERVPPGKEEQAYKTARGGLVDVEFAAQGWQMKQGMRESQTQAVLQAMRKLHPTEAGVLIKGLDFWSEIEWWIRLAEGRGGSLLPARGRDLDWLAAWCGEWGGEELMKQVQDTFQQVHAAYEKVLR